jgi:hypothetical protein
MESNTTEKKNTLPKRNLMFALLPFVAITLYFGREDNILHPHCKIQAFIED